METEVSGTLLVVPVFAEDPGEFSQSKQGGPRGQIRMV
jgi:hypothetical protein